MRRRGKIPESLLTDQDQHDQKTTFHRADQSSVRRLNLPALQGSNPRQLTDSLAQRLSRLSVTGSVARLTLCAIFLLIPILAAQSSTPSITEWKTARPDYEWTFPEDHWRHRGYKTEWWYFTGHLHTLDAPELRFGYQFTFFRIGLRPDPVELTSRWAAHNLIMGHAAVTDFENRRHTFTETLYRAVPFLGGFGIYPEPLIAWSRAPVGSSGEWRLLWNGDAFDLEVQDETQGIAFDLRTEPLKPLVLQGPGGYSRKGEMPGKATHYYSFTRLQTKGTMTIKGRSMEVEGLSWMDREFGTDPLLENQSGWDWFSLQLTDGRDLLLYRLRDTSGATDFAHGTLVSASGKHRYLTIRDWPLQALGEWKSPHSGITYPSGWTLSLSEEDLELKIIPELTAQENRSRMRPGLDYWEGSVTVRDRHEQKAGEGYVELTGYGQGSRPPL